MIKIYGNFKRQFFVCLPKNLKRFQGRHLQHFLGSFRTSIVSENLKWVTYQKAQNGVLRPYQVIFAKNFLAAPEAKIGQIFPKSGSLIDLGHPPFGRSPLPPNRALMSIYDMTIIICLRRPIFENTKVRKEQISSHPLFLQP